MRTEVADGERRTGVLAQAAMTPPPLPFDISDDTTSYALPGGRLEPRAERSLPLTPKEVLSRVAPPGAMVQCTLKRIVKGSILSEALGTTDVGYELFLSGADGVNGPTGDFIASTHKKKQKKHASYRISLDRLDLHPRYELPPNKEFGKLKSDNFMGTSFTMLSAGANPAKIYKSLWDDNRDAPGGTLLREQIATINYSKGISGTIAGPAPRTISAVLPKVDAEGNREAWGRPTSGRAASDLDVITLRAKEPEWNSQLRAYHLNFNGRVTQVQPRRPTLNCELYLHRPLSAHRLHTV